MKKRFSSLTIVFASFVGLLLGGCLSWFFIIRLPFFSHRITRSASTIDQVLDIISQHYVDSIDTRELQLRLLPKLVAELDPHSAYISREESELENQRLEGSFYGIGISFNTIIDTPVVLEVLPGGPSERAGLQAGDRILKADNYLFAGKKMLPDSVRSLLMGEAGSVVKLRLLRDGEPVTKSVVRGEVPVTSVDVGYMLDDSTGVIRITQWARNTVADFLDKYTQLKQKGLHNLIIDLRDNAGGYLEPAIRLANEFLREDQLIVYTEGKAYPKESYRADGRGLLQDIPLAILINEHSASSSEVFSGAMQDHDRATIIGRRSFGKGLVQTAFYLPDSSQLRLTIARYHTPSGRCIQKSYTLGEVDLYQQDLVRRFEGGESFDNNLDSLMLKKAPRYKTDRGRVVYGGLGIMPDRFIPIDSTGINSYYLRCLESGTLTEYAFLYADSHRGVLSQLDNAMAIVAYLDRIGSLVADYGRFASGKGIELRPGMLFESKELFRRVLYAQIAQYILGVEAFYQVYYIDDPTLLEARSSFSPSL